MERGTFSHIKSVGTRKLADFVKSEDGSVGKRSALVTAALIGASTLGQVLIAGGGVANAGSVHSQNPTWSAWQHVHIVPKPPPYQSGHIDAL